MFKTFLVGVVLGVVAAGAALYFIPVVDQDRERSLVTVQANGGNREAFHVNLPDDRIFAGRSGRDPLPAGAQWPEFLQDKDTQTELFKLRNAEERVVGVASRIRSGGENAFVEWAVHMPARGTLYLTFDDQPAATGERDGALRGGTREFAGLRGGAVERYQAPDEENANGRLELLTSLVGKQDDESVPVTEGAL